MIFRHGKISLFISLMLFLFSLEAMGQLRLLRGKMESPELYELNYRARKIISSKLDSAQLLTEAVLAKADPIIMPETVGEALITKARCRMVRGKWQEAEFWFREALRVARTHSDSTLVAQAMDLLGYSLLNQGRMDEHFDLQLKALDYRIKHKADPNLIARSYSAVGMVYYRLDDLEQAMENYRKTMDIRAGLPQQEPQYMGFTLRNMGNVYVKQGNYPEAEKVFLMAIDSFRNSRNNQFVMITQQLLADVYIKTGQFTNAEQQLNKAMEKALGFKSVGHRGKCHHLLASLHFARRSLAEAKAELLEAEKFYLQSNSKASLRDVYQLMSEVFLEQEDQQSANFYAEKYKTYKDSLFTEESTQRLAELRIQYKIQQKELEIKTLEEEQRQNRIFNLFLLFALLLATAAAFLIYRANAKRKKAYAELVVEKEKSDRLYQELQMAHKQLVQSEKMASLGQLTAGIAHEINNPINFIKGSADGLRMDFDELKDFTEAFLALEHAEDPLTELPKLQEKARSIELAYLLEEMTELLSSINRGSERISEIVKGLRAFTHQSEGDYQKEDMLELLNSALSILNNKMNKKEIKLDKQLNELPAVRCQGGKIIQVFVNIIDNAVSAMPQKGEFLIQTMQDNGHLILHFQDNGRGMNPETLNRIFDPFFTTKEVGKGTGLGMSVSYGIIKEHQGDILVESEEGKGTKVTVVLPVEGPKHF